MFRRRSTADEADKSESTASAKGAADANAVSTGKGRPTPKRREAQKQRRTYMQAPKDRKEAAKLLRERQQSGTVKSDSDVRREQSQALRSGDESKLGPRDAGPVRRLVRDVVDSRRGVGGYFLFATLGVLAVQLSMSFAIKQHVFTAATAAQLQVVLMYAWYALIVLVAFDSFVLVRRMKRMVNERHSGHTERGLAMYAVMRSLQIRRLRLPPPKVKPGEGVRD